MKYLIKQTIVSQAQERLGKHGKHSEWAWSLGGAVKRRVSLEGRGLLLPGRPRDAFRSLDEVCFGQSDRGLTGPGAPAEVASTGEGRE